MEIFAITLDTIWHTTFIARFSILWCLIGACVGAIGVWLLIPSTHNALQDIVAHQTLATSYARLRTSRYAWSALGAFVCGVLGGFGELALLPWLLALAILLLSLCVWDIYYYAVPNWQNLAFLLVGVGKSIVPFIAQAPLHPIGIDLAVVYIEIAKTIFIDLLLGAGLTSLVYILGVMFLQKHLLGEGDIVFCAGFSALFGFEAMLISVFWGCALASIVMLLGKIFTKNMLPLVPLIPCIVSGLGVGILYGIWL